VDDLIRTKMHEALEVELPDSGLRSRILSALPVNGRLDRADASGTTPIGRRTELAAGIAAILIAAVIIGSLVYARSLIRPSNVTPPITSPSPKVPRPSPTLTQSLNVSKTTPVILFTDAGNPNQIDGMTWDGQRAGKIAEIPSPGQPVCQTTATAQDCSPLPLGGGAPPVGGPESPNPAGTLFVAFPYFYDRTGHVVATLKGGPYADPGVGEYFVGTWADDELHYCQVVPIFGGTVAVPGTLQLTTPGGTPRNVARIGMQAPGANTLRVTVCSMSADRAVVLQDDSNPSSTRVAQYWVVQLSSGHVLWTHNLSGSGVANVVASRDGRYVAEVLSTGTSTVFGPDGSSVGHVSGYVQSFSWDGSLVVVVASGGRTSVVKWSDGTLAWTLPAGQGLSGFQSEPGGTSIAITTIEGALFVVSSDGRVLGQRQVGIGGLLSCNTFACTTFPPSGTDVVQVLPQLIVGAVGWADGPQRTTDGGVHWENVSPPTPANRAKGGDSNFFLDTNHAWVTAATGTVGLPSATTLVVFATADGGQTWTQSSVPISGAGSDSAHVDFIDAQHGWLITDSGTGGFDKTSGSLITQPLTRVVYATADGGVTWTHLTSANQSDGSTLGTLALGCGMSGLTFTSLNDGWLTWSGSCSPGPTGEQSGPSVTSNVAVTHDGGRSWQPVALPSFPSSTAYSCNVHSPVFRSSQGVIPVDCGGNGRPGLSAIYATKDGGRSWSLRKVPFYSQQLDFVDANTGWTFGVSGVSLFRTTDGGSHWTMVMRFASEQNAGGLSFVDTKTGFVLTSRYAPDRQSGYSDMWKTTDGGQTWSTMSSVPVGPACC
jgi:hypothetical protein